MKSKYKVYLKLNLVSLFFIAVSFLSISLAWFAYSGLSKVSTEIGVKTWYVEFQKDSKPVSNDIVVSLADIYPGMETVYENVRILNKGDSNAQLSYSIVSASVLGEDIGNSDSGTEYVEDKLAHDYPFKININLEKNFILAHDDSSDFNFSVSWPLDSGSDEADSNWGNQAYLFQKNEQEKNQNDSSYNVKPSIKVVISVKAEQYLENDDSSDIYYQLGKPILYDVMNNKKCDAISDSCIKTYVIDTNNKLGDENVTLLPDLFNNYASGSYYDYNSMLSSITGGWNVTTRLLEMRDLLKIVSMDVSNSLNIREGLSNTLIGNVLYSDRVDRMIADTVRFNGHYSFLNSKFNYLSTNKCIWISKEYNSDKAFALTKENEEISKIYGESKESSCNVVPVIIAPKSSMKS